jgi:hypothetical protein
MQEVRMGMMKTEWSTIRTSHNAFQVLPKFDIIDHVEKFNCPCNPKVEAQISSMGEVQWMTIHNSFDEYLDEDLIDPYIGL